MPSFNPADVERRWQQYWEANATFRTPDPGDPAAAGKPKCYALDMFPYPSGAGLHVGHPEGYTATDILCRFRRMSGFHVLHPMGWDAFGLPAEQHAISTGEHPRVNTQTNVNTFRRQIKALGFSYDWAREIDTTDPAYVKWTQWIFLLLHDTWYDAAAKKGRPIAELPIPADVAARGDAAADEYRDGFRLAFQSFQPVNWCPELGTVLANEEVIDGKSERGSFPVVRRPLRQWVMRITAYADRLIDDLEPLDWSPSIKKMQQDWIGKSEGAEIAFPIAPPPAAAGNTARVMDLALPTVRVYTTRPDTLWGATYLVLAPEHPLVDRVTTPGQAAAVAAYQEAAARKSDFERTELAAKTKTGVFTGAFAFSPGTGKPIPVWIADYVLAGYGTGAIMAVPAHDDRDFAFAKQFGLPITTVVTPSESWLAETKSTPDALTAAYTDAGVACNSGPLDGMTTADAKRRIIDRLEAQGAGVRRVNFKLRDWLFSRQRYWGEPFPILHELDAAGVPTGRVRRLAESDLPLRLPELADFKPTGTPDGPLSKATDWVNVTIDGVNYRRETNTMPQWAGSCWYYLRFIDPRNEAAFADPAKLNYWLPVDIYIGGAEHAVLHLLYSRFWHKVLFDRGYVPCPEPFQRLVNQGMILGEDGLKMSKTGGNVVNPDDVIREYGADSLRLYEMFMGPLEASKPWSMRNVEGVYRFLSRVWRLVVDDDAEALKLNAAVTDAPPTKETLRETHRCIKKVTEDTERLQFNTAISAMMEFTNHLTKLEQRPRAALEALVLLLAPYAPHAAEELWHALGHPDTLAYAPWPAFDPELTKAESVEIPVQVNGKLKSRVTVPPETTAADLEAAAKADPAVAAAIAGKAVKKAVVVPGKLVNFVVG